jgi:hypothetical protein
MLGLRHERPGRGRAPNQRDEFPPPHAITGAPPAADVDFPSVWNPACPIIRPTPRSPLKWKETLAHPGSKRHVRTGGSQLVF